MLYKRGKVYWYNFRWSTKQADGTVESFRIRQSAKTQNKATAKNVEEEHRRALRLGEVHPNDTWPKPAAIAPPMVRLRTVPPQSGHSAGWGADAQKASVSDCKPSALPWGSRCGAVGVLGF